ncbi:MAG: diguanylate cyclase, partial [Proteobacteria bacterium]|nr:diguanylate cyclase [Pseudomonadota bacterium]
PGGEEFVVVMPNTDLTIAQTIAERIRQNMEATPFPISADPKQTNVTISVGVSALTATTNTVEALKQKSDEALYAAKGGGRNRVVVAEC